MYLLSGVKIKVTASGVKIKVTVVDINYLEKPTQEKNLDNC